MGKLERILTYFLEPGPENTDELIKAVALRLAEGKIKTIVVASTSGNTGVKFADAFKGKAKIVVVSHEKMKPDFKEKIAKLGGTAIDETHLPLHGRGMEKIRNSFYTLGQGFKVAVEVILIATDKGTIRPNDEVIGVAGSGEGSDTAILATSTTTKEVFSEDPRKKLEIREIIAMPIKKKWW